jgi:LSD1 subclass zinc finger protein
MAECELCGRRAPAEAYLCASCALDTAERLERLPEMAEELAALLIPGRQAGDGRSSRPVHAPTPDLDRVTTRYGFGILPSWHAALFDAPGWPTPPGRIDGFDARITAACMALRASIEWIARWPVGGDLAREVKELFVDTLTLTRGRDLPARMGPCPAVHDGVLCGAPLRLPDGEQVVRCEWCQATYPPGVWVALRRAQAQASAA